MELTILERVLLLGVLPPEGNIVTLRIVGDLRKNLGFTEEELKAHNIKTVSKENGMTLTTWDNDDYKKEVTIGEKAFDVVKDALRGLSERGKLTEQHIPLYERFVEAKS